MTDPVDAPKESAKALAAFADYYALGSGRSLEKLVVLYCSRSEPSPTRHLSTLKAWSATHGWQDRIKAMLAARLTEADETDTESFVRMSRMLNECLDDPDSLSLSEVIAIRNSVRPAGARGVEPGAQGGPITINIVEREDGPQ